MKSSVSLRGVPTVLGVFFLCSLSSSYKTYFNFDTRPSDSFDNEHVEILNFSSEASYMSLFGKFSF